MTWPMPVPLLCQDDSHHVSSLGVVCGLTGLALSAISYRLSHDSPSPPDLRLPAPDSRLTDSRHTSPAGSRRGRAGPGAADRPGPGCERRHADGFSPCSRSGSSGRRSPRSSARLLADGRSAAAAWSATPVPARRPRRPSWWPAEGDRVIAPCGRGDGVMTRFAPADASGGRVAGYRDVVLPATRPPCHPATHHP